MSLDRGFKYHHSLAATIVLNLKPQAEMGFRWDRTEPEIHWSRLFRLPDPISDKSLQILHWEQSGCGNLQAWPGFPVFFIRHVHDVTVTMWQCNGELCEWSTKMHSRLLTASSAGIQGWVDRVRHLLVFSAVRHILGWHKEELGADRSDIKHWQLKSANSVPILYPELTRATPILCFTPPWAHVQLEPEPQHYYYYIVGEHGISVSLEQYAACEKGFGQEWTWLEVDWDHWHSSQSESDFRFT